MFPKVKATKLSVAKRKLVCGKGINDSGFMVYQKINGKRVVYPVYRLWQNAMRRCYCKQLQEKNPTYKGCAMCDEWLLFSVFENWVVQQNWKGKALDKDILIPGNKVYSPSTCVFVNQSVNNLLGDNRARRGRWPQGTCWHERDKRFHSECWISGAKKYLGCFDTADEAATAYDIAKAKEITRIAYLQTDVRVRNGLLKHAELRLAPAV